MPAVRYRLRADIRTGWRSLLVIVLLVGLAGGAVLGALETARRTHAAFGQMRRATAAWDVEVNPNSGPASKLTVAELAKVPGVEAVGRADGVALYPSFVSSLSDAFDLPPMLVTDRVAYYDVGRPHLVEGRQPAPTDPNGVWVDRTFAQAHHLRVGQTFTYILIPNDFLAEIQNQPTLAAAKAVLDAAPAALRGRARIDGIGVTQDGVVLDPGYDPASIVMTPAFRTAHPNLQSPYWGAMVRLAPGTDLDTFTARVRALVPDESVAFERATSVTAEVAGATGPEVVALLAFAVLAALLGLVVVGQAISRRLQLDAAHNATLAALGTTRGQRMAGSMVKILLALAVGAVLALAVAVAVSPLGPVGVTRVVAADHLPTFDWPVLLLGLLATIVIGGLLAAVPAWRSSGVQSVAPERGRSKLAGWVAGLGGSVAAVVGVRFGLEPGAGRTAVPVRTTLLAAATAVALVTAVAVFSASVDHLVQTPRLYGSAWDGQIELDNLNQLNAPQGVDPAQMQAIEARFADLMDRSGSVASSSLLQVGEVRSGAAAIPAIGLAPRHPAVEPTIAAGRAPAGPDEVALGQTTMDHLHTHIGATIELAPGEEGRGRAVRVVGRVVLPGLAPYPGSDKAGLGVGALLTQAGWKRYSSDYQKTIYVFRWAPGHSLADLTAFFRHADSIELPLTVSAVNRPAGVVSVERLRATPTLLASLVSLLLAAAVANALVVAVRRRRHDLSVLRTLGFTTGQVVRTVLWQATTVGMAALVVGIPAGLVLGRWAWTLLAGLLGTIADPRVSPVAVIALALGVLALVNLIGIGPGLRAARHPGRNLRTE